MEPGKGADVGPRHLELSLGTSSVSIAQPSCFTGRKLGPERQSDFSASLSLDFFPLNWRVLKFSSKQFCAVDKLFCCCFLNIL